MKWPTRKFTATVLVLLGIVSAGAFAPQSGAYQQGMPGMTPYDPATEVTLSGTIEEIEQVTETKSPRCTGGTHLWLDAEGARYEVHLGPSSFLEGKEWSFGKGDRIEVTGSRVDIDKQASILAREVTMKGKTLTLRDAQGMPVWRRGPGR